MFSATDVLEIVDEYLAKLPNAKMFPFPVIAPMLKCVALCLLKDILMNSNAVIDGTFQSNVFKFVENVLKESTKFIRSVEGGGHKVHEVVFYTVRMMCAATDLLVWSTKGKASI